MSDPLMTAIAATVTSKAIDGLSEAGKAVVEALVRLVRRKLGADQASRVILVGAEAEPVTETNQRALADALGRAVANDHAFAEELTNLWQGLADSRPVVAPDAVFNNVSGDVHGNVVQVRDLHGGLSFGRP